MSSRFAKRHTAKSTAVGNCFLQLELRRTQKALTLLIFHHPFCKKYHKQIYYRKQGYKHSYCQ